MNYNNKRETKEFWSELITKASWEKLQELSKKYKFLLIGGWAAYLWTKLHKSKDIDIVVDYEELRKFGSGFRLEKNERLRKYEIKLREFDIDIYLPKFSKLALPAEDLQKYKTVIDGITTVECEVLVILKQAAEIDRRGSIKGRKDRIDLLSILIFAPFDIKKYRKLLVKYKLAHYEKELINAIKNFSENDFTYIGMKEHSFAKWKKEFYNLII